MFSQKIRILAATTLAAGALVLSQGANANQHFAPVSVATSLNATGLALSQGKVQEQRAQAALARINANPALRKAAANAIYKRDVNAVRAMLIAQGAPNEMQLRLAPRSPNWHPGGEALTITIKCTWPPLECIIIISF